MEEVLQEGDQLDRAEVQEEPLGLLARQQALEDQEVQLLEVELARVMQEEDAK